VHERLSVSGSSNHEQSRQASRGVPIVGRSVIRVDHAFTSADTRRLPYDLNRAMATTHTLINDFVGLPIIISDFDALTSNANNGSTQQSQSQLPTPTTDQSSPSSTVNLAYSTSTVSAMQQNWATGFSDFADDMWAKMTQGMKQKLRGACVEVLKKTEDSDGQAEHLSWQYDDDARFLD
jgi:hypothetical protein